MILRIFIIIFTFLLNYDFGLEIVREQGDDGFEYVNTQLVNKTDNRWQTRKLIMCTKCTLVQGTIVAFQAYFRNAIAVKPLQFSLWTPDIQGMTLLSPGSATKIFTMLLSIDYDPSSLGRENSVGCNNGIHTIIIPPGKMRNVNGSALIGVIVQPVSSIVYSFNTDPQGSGLKDQLGSYENLFENTRLSPGESRQFGNLAVQEEVAFGAIVYPNSDLSFNEQERIANDLAKEKNCSGGQSSTTPSPFMTTPSPDMPSIDDIDRGPTPPPNSNGWNLGHDASCNSPIKAAIRTLSADVILEPQMKIFIFAALKLPTGTVNGFQVCVGREVRNPGEGFAFQVWRRVDAQLTTDGAVSSQRSNGIFFRLVGQTPKYQPAKKMSYTYLLEAKNRFNISEGDYFGFVNYGNETLISSVPSTKDDIIAAIAFYELSNLQQALLIGEAYKFDEALQFTRYATSILVNTTTTDPTTRTRFDGPVGPIGFAGPRGDAGPVGPKGDSGNNGKKGPKGQKGPRGPPGYVLGPKGDQGPTGPPGEDNNEKGPKGPQGQKGPKGDKGDPGVFGVPGVQGETGAMGQVGPRGDRGDVGEPNNEAVNITQCTSDTNLTSCSSSNGECLVIEHYRVNWDKSKLFANTTKHFSSPTTFESSEVDCRCKPGFELKNGHCVNVNECLIANGVCEYTCVDKEGSYLCQCPAGLKLAVDGHRCDDIDECHPNNPCQAGDICLNRYRATEALCLHKTDSGMAGEQKQTGRTVAGDDDFWSSSRNLYIGIIAWMAGLSAILIICIVLLFVCWWKGDNELMIDDNQSYDLPSSIDPKSHRTFSSQTIPEWAAEMKEDTYMQQDNGTVDSRDLERY